MKRWFHSKTIWFNVATMAVTVAGIGLQYLDQLGLTVEQQAMAGIVLTMMNTFGNMYLRTITRTGIR